MRFRLVPAAYVLLRQADRVLLQLRQNTGFRDGHWAPTADNADLHTLHHFGAGLFGVAAQAIQARRLEPSA